MIETATKAPRRAIVSLLSSATEMVEALGAIDLLVGRSHECDYPPSVRALPACTKPLIEIEADSRAIDEQVKHSARNALSIYEVFDDVLERLQPTHILTQVQCDVCAVSLRDVERSIASRLASAPEIVALNPASLADIWDDFRRVGEAVGVSAEPLIASLQNRMAPVRRDYSPTVACIEWIEPLMAAGNWTPELIDLAGGIDVFGKPGVHSPWITWDDLCAKDPEIVIVAPCGFDLARTQSEMHWLTSRPDFESLKAVASGCLFIADGNQYFNRPGPRIVETMRIIQEIIDCRRGSNLASPPGSDGCRGTGWSLYSKHRNQNKA
ncbi:MAG: cobalamin-binding protein [Acidobacteriota bacterium]|nr:cobalamin-binding protein [Acidobacteriota bacterium]